MAGCPPASAWSHPLALGAPAFSEHLAECPACRAKEASLSQLPWRDALSPDAESWVPEGARIGRFRVLDVRHLGQQSLLLDAIDDALQRSVVLKLVRGYAQPDAERALLVREAKVLAALSHPNLALVHELVDDERHCGIAMETPQGVLLNDWLATRPSLADRLRVLSEIASALQALESAGLSVAGIDDGAVTLDSDSRVRISLVELAAGDSSADAPNLPAAACLLEIASRVLAAEPRAAAAIERARSETSAEDTAASLARTLTPHERKGGGPALTLRWLALGVAAAAAAGAAYLFWQRGAVPVDSACARFAPTPQESRWQEGRESLLGDYPEQKEVPALMQAIDARWERYHEAQRAVCRAQGAKQDLGTHVDDCMQVWPELFDDAVEIMRRSGKGKGLDQVANIEDPMVCLGRDTPLVNHFRVDTAAALADMQASLLLEQQGKFQEAYDTLANSAHVAALPDGTRRSEALSIEGHLLGQLGRNADAVSVLERALKLTESLGRDAGRHQVLISLMNAHEGMANFEAAKALVPALDAVSERLQEGSPTIMPATNFRVAVLFQHTGQLDEARKRFEQVIDACRRALRDGSEDSRYKEFLSRSLVGLAAILVTEDEAAAGEKAAREAIEVFTALRGADNPQLGLFQHTLCDALSSLTRPKEAEAACLKAIEHYRQGNGEDAPESAGIYVSLAYLAGDRKAWKQSLAYLDSAAKLTEAMPEGEPVLELVISWRALTLAKLDRLAEAAPLATEALSLRKAIDDDSDFDDLLRVVSQLPPSDAEEYAKLEAKAESIADAERKQFALGLVHKARPRP